MDPRICTYLKMRTNEQDDEYTSKTKPKTKLKSERNQFEQLDNSPFHIQRLLYAAYSSL